MSIFRPCQIPAKSVEEIGQNPEQKMYLLKIASYINLQLPIGFFEKIYYFRNASSYNVHRHRHNVDTVNMIIRRSYRYLDIKMFIPLHKCLVRSHFDYAVTVRDSYVSKLVDDIESVQRRATTIIPELKNLSYSERLQKVGLPTLEYRRARGEMIEVYKIIGNIYDDSVATNILTNEG